MVPVVAQSARRQEVFGFIFFPFRLGAQIRFWQGRLAEATWDGGEPSQPLMQAAWSKPDLRPFRGGGFGRIIRLWQGRLAEATWDGGEPSQPSMQAA